VVDGVLVVLFWGDIVLTVVSMVEDLVVCMMGLVADSVLIQVSCWSVMVEIRSVGISVLPFITVDGVVSVMWGLVVGSLDIVLVVGWLAVTLIVFVALEFELVVSWLVMDGVLVMEGVLVVSWDKIVGIMMEWFVMEGLVVEWLMVV